MIRQCAGYLARHPLMRKLAVSTPVVRDLAWRYVAGESLDAGIAAVRGLNARGIKGTLNFVGTHVRDQADAVQATDAAIEALRRIQHEGIDSNYSLKLTQIGLDIAPEVCRQQLRRVLDAAAQAAAVTFTWNPAGASPALTAGPAAFSADEISALRESGAVGQAKPK